MLPLQEVLNLSGIISQLSVFEAAVIVHLIEQHFVEQGMIDWIWTAWAILVRTGYNVSSISVDTVEMREREELRKYNPRTKFFFIQPLKLETFQVH